MLADFHHFGRSVVQAKHSQRFFSILMTLLLLLGNLQPAAAASGDSRLVATSPSVIAQPSEGATARELALAMGVPEGDIVAADLMGSDLRGVAVITTTLGTAGFPTQGSTFAVLATGLAAEAGLPNNEGDRGSDLGGSSNSQGQDLVRLHLQLKVPDKINCASFGFAYYSEEFPEYVGDKFNDTFSAQINESDLPIADNAVSAPGNFAFDTAGNIISVNTSFGVQSDTGATYDGATPPLSAQTTVVPSSVIDLYFSIQDLGDSAYDSAVFLDKFFWSEDPNCKEGAKVDADGDGLLDIWETEGLTVTVGGVTEFVNLPAMGAHLKRKDIFVEIDYMVEYSGTNSINHTHQPIPVAIADVVTAFANAPVTNTDNTTGIRLHVDYGKNAPLTYGITTTNGITPTWGALSKSDAITETVDNAYLGVIDAQDNYSWAAFDQIKQSHFTPGRAAVFHYNMWIHSLPKERGGSSGQSRNPDDFDSGASDFIVSLGDWGWTNNVGTPRDQAGTFMHEFGHNLGLRHGGTQWYNYKPNYLSVMNYAFQFDGLIKNDSQGNFDYSRVKLPDLNEQALDEATSLITTTAVADKYGTYWFCGAQAITSTKTLTSPIDWNCDSVISTTVTANINAGRQDQPDNELALLGGASDWDRLVYMGGALGLPGASVELPVVTEAAEMTKEEADLIPALYPEILAAAPDTVETWALQSTLTGHTGPVWGVAWSPDGSQFASGSDDMTVRVWDAATGAALATLSGPGGEIYGVAWSPDGSRIAAGAADTIVWVWEVATGEVVARLEGNADAVRTVAWSPDGSRLASASADGAVRTWNAASWSAENTLSGHTSTVNSVAWSPDGAELASGADDMTVRMWDAATGAALATYEGHTDRVWSVAWSPDGARLASGSEDGTVLVWDMVFDAYLTTLAGHTAGVRSVAWSPDSAQLASGAMDQTARVWDIAAERTLATLEGAADAVNSVAWSPDGLRLLTGAGDAAVRLWGREAFKEHAQWDIRTEIVGLGVDVLSTAWAPTDSRIAYGTGDGVLRIWNPETGEVLTVFDAHTDGIRSVAWSPDGGRVVSASYDRTVRVWDAATGEGLGILEGHITQGGIPWSPDGNRLASSDGAGANTLRIWDVTTGETLAMLAGHTDEVAGVAWSPDGSRIATGSLDQTVRVWDAAVGETIATFTGHTAPVNSVAWSPDGSQLASGADDMTVRVWDVATGASQATLEGHTARVTSVAWSPDGSQLASAASDATIRIWDAATGAELATLGGHTDAVRSVSWSPAGNFLASGGNDGSVRVWNALAERIWITPESAGSSSSESLAAGNAASDDVAIPAASASPVQADRFPLAAGSSLVREQKYPSESGNHYLIFLLDGDVAVFTVDDQYVWGLKSITDQYAQAQSVQMQPDGNFVVRGADAQFIWSALSANPDASAYLTLTPEGVLRLVSGDTGATLWASDGDLSAVAPVAEPAADATTAATTEAAAEPAAEPADSAAQGDSTQPPATVTDADGNVYPTVQVGDQLWMAENLRTATCSDGAAIPLVSDQDAWVTQTEAAYTWGSDVAGDAQAEAEYGALYNAHAAALPCNVCPSGWRVPTQADFQSLLDSQGADAHLKLSDPAFWGPDNQATNASGWSARPAGGAGGDAPGSYDFGKFAYFWSTTPSTVDANYLMVIHAADAGANGLAGLRYGFSIRCVQDLPVAAAPAATTHAVHWAYAGDEVGPENWGELDHTYAACSDGLTQSPINITVPQPEDLANLVIAYRPSPLRVRNNGHTVVANYAAGSYIEVDGERYVVDSLHYHTPSEHIVDGQPPFDAELHIVHKKGNDLAVIGILLKEGAENPAYQPLLDNLPGEEGTAVNTGVTINAADLLPAEQTTYRYSGSLTTPPCTEGVSWFVMTTPVELSAAQLADFQTVFTGNARPVQPLNERELVEDTTP